MVNLNDEKLAEFVGIVLGDGSIGIYNCFSNGVIKKQHRLKISFDSREKSYINYVSELVYDLFGETPHISKRSGENTTDLLILKKSIVLSLLDEIRLIKSPKWGRAEIPAEFIKIPLERAVLRGYSDTDGSVVITNNNGTIYPRLEMKVCPSPMQKQIRDILERTGLKFGTYNVGKGEIRIQINGVKQLQLWVELIGFSNLKHQERAINFLNG